MGIICLPPSEFNANKHRCRVIHVEYSMSENGTQEFENDWTFMTMTEPVGPAYHKQIGKQHKRRN